MTPTDEIAPALKSLLTSFPHTMTNHHPELEQIQAIRDQLIHSLSRLVSTGSREIARQLWHQIDSANQNGFSIIAHSTRFDQPHSIATIGVLHNKTWILCSPTPNARFTIDGIDLAAIEQFDVVPSHPRHGTT